MNFAMLKKVEMVDYQQVKSKLLWPAFIVERKNSSQTLYKKIWTQTSWER